MAKIERNEMPDAVQAAPKTTKVLFENDKIRVLEERFKKGQKVAMHSHPPHFGYAVTRMKFKLTGLDGKTALVKMKKGEYSSGGASKTLSRTIYRASSCWSK
jgi:hypothetical protein